MKIAIDGMGGDHAPQAVVEGVVQALKEFEGVEMYITGPENIIAEELKKYDYPKDRVKIIDATEVITTNEHPVMAVRKKKDSSIVKALHLVKEGECDAIISGGSTGAFLAGCTFIIGRIKGVERPALAPIMPGRNGNFMVVDVGANVDCKPQYLAQFAKMGRIYYEAMFDTNNASIGLVNIGAEEEKGNELTKAAYQLLKEEDFNFVGNVEPRDIPTGDVNVLVTDGFVGNTVLKMYEGSASTLEKIQEIIADKLSIDAEEITLDSSFIDDLNADSLDIVELIMALEDELEMEIPDEDVENFKTVGDVVNYVKTHHEE